MGLAKCQTIVAIEGDSIPYNEPRLTSEPDTTVLADKQRDPYVSSKVFLKFKHFSKKARQKDTYMHEETR